MLALRVQGVGADLGAGQVERGQQAGEAGNRVGLVRDPQPGDGASGPGRTSKIRSFRATCEDTP